ncbi:RsmD family RNA methyltransferase [Nocardioides sp. LHG3406-4]|uniref:RsmD family RNA methyltransferase n=1 Tax=Nocardioides sp. LHG3406-4 TaxID=2804575 RepID=UPI003CEAD743
MRESLSFGTLEIAFDERVLRPREWTAAQSRWAAELLGEAPQGPVLELCAGAGHIGLLAVTGTARRLVCVDADPVACEFARANAHASGLGEQVEVREGRLEEALRPDELFALVIADPPWVCREETGRFPEDPLLAIDGGPDGLDVARTCLGVIAAHLMPTGSAVLQLGSVAQVEALREDPRVRALELHLAETRPHERGVLVRVDRAPDERA